MTDWMTDEERGDVETALRAAEAGEAGHWPTVAAVLRDEVLRLRAERGALQVRIDAALEACGKPSQPIPHGSGALWAALTQRDFMANRVRAALQGEETL